MKIPNSTAAWVLAELYIKDGLVPRMSLLRGLCQASFDSMNDENEFSNTIAELGKAGYIEQPFSESRYQITEMGIIIFRKEIGTPLQKAQDNYNEILELRDTKYDQIINALDQTTDITLTAAKLCVKNAPLVLEFVALLSTLI